MGGYILADSKEERWHRKMHCLCSMALDPVKKLQRVHSYEPVREPTHCLSLDRNSSDSRAWSVVNSGFNMVIVESAVM